MLWLQEGEKGATQLVVGDTTRKLYVAATVPGPISNVKLKVLDEGKVAIAVSGKASSDGSLFNPETITKPRSSAKLYDSLMVRHWDAYVSPERQCIWYGILQMGKPHITEDKGRYTLSNLVNALEGTHLESPIPPFGDTGHFDISSTGLVFVAKDPTLDPALHTKSNFYYLSITDFAAASSKRPRKLQIDGMDGACSSPIFSPNGQAAAFLQQRQDGYESDKNRIIFVANVEHLAPTSEILRSQDGHESWDRSPESISFSNDGETLYIIAEDEGHTSLFKLPITPKAQDNPVTPEKLTGSGSVSAIYPLSTSSPVLLLSSTSFTDNSIYTLLDPSTSTPTSKLISSQSGSGLAFNLSSSQVSSTWFPSPVGNTTRSIHAWVVKPSEFASSKSYPIALLVHGGPQSAWTDSWSTRWNPAIFAEQGYIVVLPNPTGSTGYGQAFVDDIHNSWGGRPYEDLVAFFHHLKTSPEFDFADTNRAVALGASYGGYMMNWINGHDLGREFKALVCHDGVFSMTGQTASDEQYFPVHDLGGPIWEAQENWDKWDPSRHTDQWETPELVIHNELDYRLSIAEGLSAFNVLQTRGIKSRFLTFPNENHWVLKEENSRVWHHVVINWINGFVGLPPLSDEGGGDLGVEVQGKKSEEEGDQGKNPGLARR